MSFVLPFTAQDIRRAVQPAFMLGVKRVQERPKPRASGLSGRARNQASTLSGTSPSDTHEERDYSAFTQEQGRKAEDITVDALKFLRAEDDGVFVGWRERGLPDDFFVTGHMDGVFWKLEMDVCPACDGSGEDYTDMDPDTETECPECTGTGEVGRAIPAFEENGEPIMVGFEHKHLGTWAYTRYCIWGDNIEEANFDHLIQGALYCEARNLDYHVWVITSQDARAMNTAIERNRDAKDPKVRYANNAWVDPKLMVFVVDMRPWRKLLTPHLRARAEALSRWKVDDGNPANVKPEYDPDGLNEYGDINYPCSWCEYRTVCKEDGDSGIAIPCLPNQENR